MIETRDNVQKYVRLPENDEIIIFPPSIDHDTFKRMKPVSGGFCYIHSDHVVCFGKYTQIKMDPSDGLHATKQLFGYESMIKRIAKFTNKKKVIKPIR